MRGGAYVGGQLVQRDEINSWNEFGDPFKELFYGKANETIAT